METNQIDEMPAPPSPGTGTMMVPEAGLLHVNSGFQHSQTLWERGSPIPHMAQLEFRKETRLKNAAAGEQ